MFIVVAENDKYLDIRNGQCGQMATLFWDTLISSNTK